MLAPGNPDNFYRLRMIHRVLVMHYVDGMSRAEVAAKAGLTHQAVARLLNEGRARGYLQIDIRTPLPEAAEDDVD